MTRTAIAATAIVSLGVSLVATAIPAQAVAAAISQWMRDLLRRGAKERNAIAAGFWGMLTGFTSFISHAGGPPFQAYTVPLKLDKLVFAGTGVVAFAVINAVKVVPYFALGQFSGENLLIALHLMPVACLGVLLGIWLVKRVSQRMFYQITYLAMIVIGGKLLWDGRGALAALIG